jgi:hypothetical protein
VEELMLLPTPVVVEEDLAEILLMALIITEAMADLGSALLQDDFKTHWYTTVEPCIHPGYYGSSRTARSTCRL